MQLAHAGGILFLHAVGYSHMSHKTNLLLSNIYWLFNGDPYNGLV